jgi:hypothetical protein
MSNLLSELKLWLKNKQFKVKPTSIYVVPTQDVEDRFIQLSHKIAELEKNISMLEQYNGSVESLIKDIEANNLDQQAKALQFALENITNPELIYNRLKALKEKP